MHFVLEFKMQWWFVLFVLMPVSSLQSESSVPQNITSRSPCTDTNHLFLAPGVLTAGGTNRACVSRFDPEGPARMLVTLVTDGEQTATASRELPPGDGGCIDLTVPQKPNTKGKLTVSLWYPEAQCAWERQLAVMISSGRVVVVHTEKARYRPGDTLRARLIVLKPDLTPSHGLIDEVWLEGPTGAWEGARAAQWARVRTRMGLAQLQHELDELAPAGRWTVRAQLADGSQGSAVFWVGNYELPPFQLSVRHAPRVLRTSERLVWTVCVRYPWTEAVEGMLVIRIRGAGGTMVAQEANSSIKTVVRIKAPRACHRHAAAARRIGLNGTNPPDVVVADFSFQEDGTRIWQNTTVVSDVVDKPVTLEFLRRLRAVISPGLPYKLKVKATRWDDKPAANERIKVCRSRESFAANLPLTSSNDSCHDAVTDDRGMARVTFTANNDGSSFYSFQASLQNDSTVYAAPLNVAARYAGSVHASLGPIKPDANSARTYVPLFINLKSVAKPLTVHFVVVTRGGIIYRWGATTQCPQTSSSDYIPTTSRNSQCFYNNDVNSADDQANAANIQANPANTQANVANTQTNTANNQSNDSDSLLDRHLLRIMLPIKVTHQMCPDSHLVAYFYYNGELVSASKQFEMDECFSNKVEATWLSRQTAPGSTASLRISTPGPALCALSVLDSAAKGNQPAPTIKEVVMNSLKRLMVCHRNLTEYEAAGSCFNTSDVPELPTNSLELTASWLAGAGVRIAGGDMALDRRCSSEPAPLMEEATAPRSDFSEAWLWRLAAVGTNGTATISARAPDSISRFEASAVCLARTGIAVSPPAVLQVFREFFIHADSPKRLRRGDSTIIRYRLFNYLYHPLSVQIQILTDAHLSGLVTHVESACVSARSSVARRVELQATVSGDARLSIKAKSVRDANCANGTVHNAAVSDEVIIHITVDPEGVPVQEHKSILLCARGSPESSRSEVSWSWSPIQPVPGTEALTVWAVGDVRGPLLFDADALVTLPRGCGEQNMARLATNLLALTQLDPTSSAAATAKEHVARGFIRQLQYIHPSGGFSAFGASDASPSTWLTAFSLRYLLRAHKVLTPGLPIPPSLKRAEQWLLDQQMENGCFRNEGQVFHRELRGGLSEEGEIASVALTAYVITAFVDSTTPLSTRVLHNTLSCLRALPPMKTRSPTKVYAHALLGYAFMRLRNYEDELRKTNEASLLWDKKEAIGAGLKEDEEMRELLELLQMAKRSGDYVWWETSSLSTSIEATAYALLALSYCPAERRASCANDARAAVRWLSAHRNHAGGFLSTQDTLVALEALTSWSSVQPSATSDLTVKIRSGSDVKKILIQPDMKVPDITRIAGKSQVDVAVEGTGCALIQATRSYNTMSADVSKDKLLTVQAAVHTDGTFDCDVNGTSCFCAAVLEVCVTWAGPFPEMAVVEATLPPSFGADAHKLYAQLQDSNSMLRRIELTPNGGRTTLYLGVRDGVVSNSGHRCFEVHAVGPRARTKPAHVRVIDYYTPTINDTQMYTIPEDCPPRITHSPPEYQASDNLFSKAKSLNDDEILITHEFSFEDIPEGIPLDDPLYDFNRDDVAFLSKYNEIERNPYHDLETRSSTEDINEPNEVTVAKKEKSADSSDYASKNVNFNQGQIKENFEVNTYAHKYKPIVTQNSRKGGVEGSFETSKSPRQRNPYSFEGSSTKNVNEANFRQNRNFYFRPNNDQIHTYPGDMFYYFRPKPRRIDKQNFHNNPNIQYYKAAESRPMVQEIQNEYERRFNYSVEQDFRPIAIDKEQENIYKADVNATAEQAANNYEMGIQIQTENNANPFVSHKEPSKYNQHFSQLTNGQNDKISYANHKTDSIPQEVNIKSVNKASIQSNLASTVFETDRAPEVSISVVNPDISNIDMLNSNEPVKDSLTLITDIQPDMSSFSNANPNQGAREPEAALQVDNPNLSSFHVIDSERDLEVPSGLEGPVPAIALPPQNFVAVAPPPGFQSPFMQSGFPRGLPPPGLYTFPYRPHSYYRQIGRYSPAG